jgi:DNA-binding XRE family transcriptional regulator
MARGSESLQAGQRQVPPRCRPEIKPHVDFIEREDDVGWALRFARVACGVTQRELAHATGIAGTHLSAIEAGRHVPQPCTIEKILDYLSTKHVEDELPQSVLNQSRAVLERHLRKGALRSWVY